ncbi:MAG: hypothetical protein Q8908_14790, partial [Bacteroidota bacterium]|nr:hypothetical protein [Bacteroidota bacterium]
MKTLLLLIVITLFYLPTMGQCKYEINGYIENIDTASNKAPFNQGTNIILRFLNFKKSDTVQLFNHAFKFKGDVPEPSVAMIDYPSGGVKVLIDSNSYNVYLKEVQIDKIHYTYKDTIITRSKYFNLWRSFGDDLTLLYQNKSKLLNEIDKMRNTDSISNLKNKINEIDEKMAYDYKEVAINNPGNYAIAYFLSAAPDFSYKNYIDIYNVLSEKVKNSYYGKKLFEKLNSI